ncbi:MAG TPA: hypothetical protein VG500_11555 [Gemmatimonadales bacterium]|nr:hypothetical protein [Gemmatimonadales bacterium]
MHPRDLDGQLPVGQGRAAGSVQRDAVGVDRLGAGEQLRQGGCRIGIDGQG